MAKICWRALHRFQIYSFNGDVRICGWMRDMYLGSLLDHSVEELYQGSAAQRIRDRLFAGDYSMCMEDCCPYIANHSVSEVLVECNQVPIYPTQLALGFEQTCNYACTGCTFHSKPNGVSQEQLEKNYQIIEDRIRDIMPHITSISANGCGELFASKHILRLLADWRPIAPAEQIEVSLETNGSLFDEKHWRQIENLGQYHLSVSVSVMSFQEDIYQYLSGTSLPIGQIEKNLKFIKNLRKQEIINRLEIATVVQEQNFREMPEFTRRCIEEFGADTVRLRPYAPWGAEKPDVAWFKNPRNPRHPLYNEYRHVMENPIFQHPAVEDWSGGNDSRDVLASPFQKAVIDEHILGYLWRENDIWLEKLLSMTPQKNGKVAIYGVSNLAKILVRKLDQTKSFTVEYMIDRDCKEWYFNEKRIWRHIHLKEQDKDLLVIIALLEREDEIRGFLKGEGFQNCISLRELVADEEIQKELETL